jgi:carbon monoxide dehydrogenase subunit G
MVRCEVTLDVARPPSEVFAFVDDVSQCPRWLSRCAELTMTSPPPKRAGSTLYYRYKEGSPGGSMDGVVRAWEKDKRLEMEFKDKLFEVEIAFAFEPAGAGTRIHHTVVISPKPVLAKLMSPMIRKMTEKQIAQDTAALKRLLEANT